MLSNTQIRDKVNSEQLISEFDETCLKNCSYRLRIGKLIKPGGEGVIDLSVDNEGKKSKGWLRSFLEYIGILKSHDGTPSKNDFRRYVLKPNELILFQTREEVKLPMNLSASYVALDSVAKQGLLLINASMVEPEYEGYLSGVLLNFSSKNFIIKPNMEIAKINFYEVTGNVEVKRHERITDYTEDLLDKAQNYTQTFLDVDRIENEVVGKTVRRVRRNFIFGGITLVFFLAFCTIEPVLYKYVWHDSWVPLNSTQIEMERALQHDKETQLIDSLIKKVDSLQQNIDRLNDRKPDSKPKTRV